MERTETRGNIEIRFFEDRRYKSARLKPKGFWAEIVNVDHRRSFEDDAWMEPEITWGGGGWDGTVSEINKVRNFIEALSCAIEIAREWKS